MGVTTTKTNKPLNPRGNDQSPLAFNRAKLYSGKALDFDGVNDSITTNLNTTIFSDSGTISGYLNLDGLGGVKAGFGFRLSNQSEFYFLFVGNNSEFRLRTTDGITDVVTDLSEFVGRWTLFTCTFGAGVMSLYTNDTLIASENYTGDFRVNASSYYVFGESGGGAFWYDGLASNARVFNTALTAAQVADLYNNPEKVVPTGVSNTALKLWLPMMEGAGTTAYDGSGNGNHGTISGATYVNGVGAPVSQSAVMDWNKGTNYQTYSEDFSTAWALYSVSISTDQTTAPDGLNTADLYDDGTGTGLRVVEKTCAPLSSAVGVSGFLYAKYIDTQYLVLGTYDTGYHFAVYDIQNGTLGSKMGGVTSSIEAAGNGFYKCSFTYSANTRINPYISFSLRDDDIADYFSGTGTNRQAYIWGASMRPTTDGDAYVKTGATAQTTPVLLPQGLTTGRDITGVNLFENVRKQGALNLDGNSWAEVHDNASVDITSAITLEAWVYLDSAPIDNVDSMSSIMTKKSANVTDSEAAFDVRATGSNGSIAITGGFDTGALQTINIATGLSIDQWYHIGITYDSGSVVTYLNGAQVNTGSMLSPIIANAYDVWIGRHVNAGGLNSYALADIAQPRIYNRALTAEEVQRSYDSGKNIYTNS